MLLISDLQGKVNHAMERNFAATAKKYCIATHTALTEPID